MFKNRSLFFLVLLTAVTFALMTYQSKRGYLAVPQTLGSLLNNSHAAATSLVDTVVHPFRQMAVREEENTRLRNLVNDLLIERDRYHEAMLENRRLKELLGLRESQPRVIAAARVIARGIDSWSHTLVIDKGYNDGIAKDMAAITPRGLAGKISLVSASSSYILLPTDRNFAAAVRTREGRREGVVSGTGSRRCILKYIPFEEEVTAGDIVITSGLDALFPPGIAVGYVSRVDTTGQGNNFQQVEVMPFQDDTRIEEVLIIQ